MILPLFALSNAGVAFNLGEIEATLTSSTSLGIILGLVVGKQVGITAGAWLALKTRLAVLPEGISIKQIYGGAALCGIGFTMSLFIANLAFAGEPILDSAKIGILAASLISATFGLLVLYMTTSYQKGKSAQENTAQAA
jgi:NhaA family Na+:H+ antiporter